MIDNLVNNSSPIGNAVSILKQTSLSSAADLPILSQRSNFTFFCSANITDPVTSQDLSANCWYTWLNVSQEWVSSTSIDFVNTAIQSAILGIFSLRGGWDASGDLFPTTGGTGESGAVAIGDTWIITVAGTLGGEEVEPNDLIIALVDVPGQTSSNWAVVSNLVLSVNGQTGTVVITYSDVGAQQLNSNLTTLSGASLTGTGDFVRATSPSLTTPILGAATATSINGLGITNTSGGQLGIADNQTVNFSNSITFTANTGGVTLGIGGGGVLGSSAYLNTGTAIGNVVQYSMLNGIGDGSTAFLGLANMATQVGSNLTVSSGIIFSSGSSYNGSAARTISIDTSIVATLTGIQTLTDKILTSPVINSPTGITKSDVGLSDVENTALSTWPGTTNITTLGTISTGVWAGSLIGLDHGGTHNDLSVTGGASQVLRQSTLGGNVTVSQLASTDLSDVSSLATLTGPQIVTNKTISGASNTLSNIGNGSLTNSSITINGNSVSLGGSTTVTANTPNALTVGTGLQLDSGTTFNGSAARTISLNASASNLTNGVIGSGSVVLSNSAIISLATLISPILGTPISGTLTNCTGLPISTGVSGLGTGVATFLATPSSANLASAVTDETGSGALVFATSPSLTTPTLGVASATSINKVAITAPATSATLTIADGKTLTASNTLTFTGTDASSVAFGAGGTVVYQSNPSNTPLDLNGGTLTASTGKFQTLVQIQDTDASNYMQIGCGSNLTADRLLTITPGDAARTITLTGSPTLNDWFDQSVKQAATPTFAGLTSATLTGGTGTTSTLTLKSTSGVGATGANIIFQAGNNGATEIARMLNNGNMGIGKTSPQYKLHVQHSSNTDGITVQNSNGGAGSTTNLYFQTYADSAGVTSPNAAISAVDTGNFGSNVIFYTKAVGSDANTLTERMRLTSTGSVLLGGTSALATNATDGFVYIPGCAGTPSGVPTSATGKVAMLFDTSANKLWVYNGAWKSTTLA